MINYHSTAKCPCCGKDSWQSEYKAYFVPVRCTWCGKMFKFDHETNAFKEVNERKGTK